MNATLLTEMLAASSSAGANPALLQILAGLQSSESNGAVPFAPDLMAKMEQTNPMMAVLARHLAEQSAARADRAATLIDGESTEIVAPDEQPPDAAAIVAMPSAAQELAELRSHAESMYSELKFLRERQDLLAAALGACCLCWGEDEDCRACRGRGLPGYAHPDEALFEELVLPAVRLLRAQRARLGGAPSRAAATPTRAGSTAGPG